MAATDIVGTWFPSGYYGHYRSKTRNDILQEYRHEATPLPPNQFVKWVRKSPDTHRFSKHDNKHSFPTDASYFDTGMGKRKANASVTAFNREFMAWMPHKEDIAREGSSVSLYKLDFRKGGIKSSEPLPQRLSPRIRRRMADMDATDARLKWISDYKKQFSHGQPNPRIFTDVNTGQRYDGNDTARSHQYINKTGKLTKVIPPYIAHIRRRTKSAPPIRYSVGDCLTWNPMPMSASTIYNSTSFKGKSNQPELTPRPPTESRSIDTIQSPRISNYRAQQITKTDPHSRTPAATAISSFAPTQSCISPRMAETHQTTTSIANTRPVVVID